MAAILVIFFDLLPCPLRLSCVFLANYVPKVQMSSGLCGPIFLQTTLTTLRSYRIHLLDKREKTIFRTH